MKLTMKKAEEWMATNLVTEDLHSSLGASSGDRWINCTGSYELQKEYENTTSIFAAEGTFAHAFSEMLRVFQVPAQDYLGLPGVVDGFPFEVNKEMIDHIQGFVDRADDFGGKPFYEVMVDYSNWASNEDTLGFGTADDIRIREGICKVTDLKYGKGVPVIATDNTQGKLYCLGVLAEYGHLYDIDKFIICIDQPRKDHYQEWEITTDDLIKWGEEVVSPAAKATTSDAATVVAGSWCKWCLARAKCWVKVQEVLRINTDKAFMSNNDLATLLPLQKRAIAFWEELSHTALSELNKGQKVGDYKVVEGRSNRVWTSEEAAVKAMKKAKLKTGEIFTKKLIGIGAAEKLLGKKHELFEDKSIVNKPAGKATLAPGSDKRSPLTLDADKEFS